MEYTHTYTDMTPAQAHQNGQIDAQRVSEGYNSLVTIWRFEQLPAEVQAAYWAGRKGEPLPPSPAPQARALSRTWATLTRFDCFGENWGSAEHTVTLTRAYIGGPLSAEVDGNPAPVADAVRILNGADRVTVLAETLAPASAEAPAAQPLSAAPVGKVTARRLHVELSRLGYREHYTAAADALGRPVSSLAALTAAEVRTVYSYAYGSLGIPA